MNLADKYRPSRWEDVIGQERAVSTVLGLRDRGVMAGRAYWLSGQSGTGKTTLAKLIASEIASEWSVEQEVGGSVSVGLLDDWRRASRLSGMGSKLGRAYIIDEAHLLSSACIDRLMGILEPIPSHVAWILTTTLDGQDRMVSRQIDAGPLLSRCTQIRLHVGGTKHTRIVAESLKRVAVAEGLDGRPIEEYEQLYTDENYNMRGSLNRIEAGEMVA